MLKFFKNTPTNESNLITDCQWDFLNLATISLTKQKWNNFAYKTIVRCNVYSSRENVRNLIYFLRIAYTEL